MSMWLQAINRYDLIQQLYAKDIFNQKDLLMHENWVRTPGLIDDLKQQLISTAQLSKIDADLDEDLRKKWLVCFGQPCFVQLARYFPQKMIKKRWILGEAGLLSALALLDDSVLAACPKLTGAVQDSLMQPALQKVIAVHCGWRGRFAVKTRSQRKVKIFLRQIPTVAGLAYLDWSLRYQARMTRVQQKLAQGQLDSHFMYELQDCFDLNKLPCMVYAYGRRNLKRMLLTGCFGLFFILKKIRSLGLMKRFGVVLRSILNHPSILRIAAHRGMLAWLPFASSSHRKIKFYLNKLSA